MKKNFVVVFALLMGILVSCDKDFNTIGSDVVGAGSYNFEKYPVENIKAYSRPTGAVQSNNLPVNALGVYTDPAFGTSIAHFVTDLQLERSAPDFGFDIDIQSNDSVYIYIPFFSTQTATGSGNEANTFELDSIKGDVNSSFSLKIYHNNYFIRSLDASDPIETQKYFSDEKNLIESGNLGIQLNNSIDTSENDDFLIKNEEIIIYETDGNGAFLDSDDVVTVVDEERVVKERFDPGIWINLDKTFFLQQVLQASDDDLLNNNNFKEHLKGLYFQVAQNSGEEGAMAMLDFSKGYVNIQYHSKDEDTTEAELKKKSFKLNLQGNTINFFDNNFSISDGDEELYLKGANGSVVYLDLFGEIDVKSIDEFGELVSGSNGVPDELDELRAAGVLINDAVLTFTVKQPNIQGEEPKRIYVYDATNNSTILDYRLDSSSAADFKNNKFVFGGFLEIDENDNGIRYRIRLTSHINNLINGDNIEDVKNVVLGISLTDNINTSSSVELKNIVSIPVGVPNSSTEDFENIPQSSIITPLGTVLYGNHPNVDEENKVKLEIYYTNPN